MPFDLAPGTTWLVGDEVSFYKSVMREIDQHYCMAILEDLLKPNGSLHAVARTAQAICDEAGRVVTGAAAQNPQFSLPPGVPAGPPLLHTIWNDAAVSNLHRYIRDLSRITILSGHDNLVNPLGLGDFTRAFAELITKTPNEVIPHIAAYGTFFKSLQNAAAFSKTTNRVRFNRWNDRSQVAELGVAVWYLPSTDVLGAIDRMLGYYETADISGSATDALAVLAMLSTVSQARQFDGVGALKQEVVSLVNSGHAFGAFLGMVAQQHHSLPEVMMAINLIPGSSLVQGPPPNQPFNKVYSPLLTNTGLALDRYDHWRMARDIAFGGDGNLQPGEGRLFVVLQDVYQMPNKGKPAQEIGVIQSYTYPVNGGIAEDNNNPGVFGYQFYDQVVAALRVGAPGPAIPLERLVTRVVPQTFVNGQFNPALPPAQSDEREAIVQAAIAGMSLRDDAYDSDQVDDLVALAEPFGVHGAYGEILDASLG